MLGAYVLPLWHILLDAPQYPEGLEMKIWLNGLSGNINQINGLNHYIGMKHIAIGDFREFTILPYVFGAVLALGAVAAIINSRKLAIGWFTCLCLFAIIGFSDFYVWEYNYGHHLNPHAAIKVEGMNYQPPLVGYKQLLNFTAGSLPDTGGLLVGLGGVLGIVAVIKKRSHKNSTQANEDDHETHDSDSLPDVCSLHEGTGSDPIWQGYLSTLQDDYHG
jgi:copper chaperone NosL